MSPMVIPQRNSRREKRLKSCPLPLELSVYHLWSSSQSAPRAIPAYDQHNSPQKINNASTYLHIIQQICKMASAAIVSKCWTSRGTSCPCSSSSTRIWEAQKPLFWSMNSSLFAWGCVRVTRLLNLTYSNTPTALDMQNIFCCVGRCQLNIGSGKSYEPNGNKATDCRDKALLHFPPVGSSDNFKIR